MKVDLSAHYARRKLLRTVVPTILMMVVNSLYSIVNGLFVSRFVGAVPFASVNFLMPVLMVGGALGTLVSFGGAALVSKMMGEGRRRQAEVVFSMLIKVLIIAGIVLTVLGLLFIPALCKALGANDEMLPHCVLYGRICILGAVPMMLSQGFQAFYMTAEKPQLGTVMSVACGVVNIVLDALLVAALGWGLKGAAVASVLAEGVNGFVPLWYFLSRRNNSSLRLRLRAGIRWSYVVKAAFNGLSEFVSSITMSVLGVCYNAQLMHYGGSDGVAAYGIVMYFSFIFSSMLMGYNFGVEPIIGYNFGAQNRKELKGVVWQSLQIVATAGVMMAFLSEACSGVAARLFVGYDADLALLATRAMRIYMLCFLVCGISMFVSSLFTALNNGVVSAILSFVRTALFETGSVLLLPQWLGIDGIWMAVDVAEVLSLLMCSAFFFAFRSRYGY